MATLTPTYPTAFLFDRFNNEISRAEFRNDKAYPVCALPGGRFAVAYVDWTVGDGEFHINVYDSNGEEYTNITSFNYTGLTSPFNPSVLPRNGGGFIAFVDCEVAGQRGIKWQIFDENYVPGAPAFTAITGTNMIWDNLAFSRTYDSDFLYFAFNYRDDPDEGNGNSTVRFGKLTSFGTVTIYPTVVDVGSAPANTFQPDGKVGIAAYSGGGVAVFWDRRYLVTSDSNHGIWGRSFDASGNALAAGQLLHHSTNYNWLTHRPTGGDSSMLVFVDQAGTKTHYIKTVEKGTGAGLGTITTATTTDLYELYDGKVDPDGNLISLGWTNTGFYFQVFRFSPTDFSIIDTAEIDGSLDHGFIEILTDGSIAAITRGDYDLTIYGPIGGGGPSGPRVTITWFL